MTDLCSTCGAYWECELHPRTAEWSFPRLREAELAVPKSRTTQIQDDHLPPALIHELRDFLHKSAALDGRMFVFTPPATSVLIDGVEHLIPPAPLP